MTAYMVAVPCNDSEVLRDTVAVVLTKVDDSLSERRSVSVLADSLLVWSAQNRQAFESFAKSLLRLLLPCLKDVGKKPSRSWKERIWRNFHVVCVSSDLTTLWKSQPTEVCSGDSMHCQMLVTAIMEHLIKVHYPVEVTSLTHQSEQLATSTEEQKVIRYMAGYIPVSLRKKLERSSHHQKEEFILCLWGMCEDETDCEDFLAYTRHWVDRVNRGGLFIVSDLSYLLFEQLELNVRKLYNLSELDTSSSLCSRDEVREAVVGSDDVQFYWSQLSSDLDDDGSHQLLRMIVDLWITIRGFSFVRSFMEQYKQAHAVGILKLSLFVKL
ncbi:uncharacterized protein LOC134184753 [Corticium candelabrum]|uniref:uncharacterized protein LOC134184753 n=1 Tax=Corticium candelabrum TaxID=121492 RepID=UPI002E36F8B4|nr:uncharacterized protein LOC134184753 [Corticium candelabrum]